MAYREPIPSNFDLQSVPVQQNQFGSIEDVNRVVQQLICDVSREGRYTGVGCIQEEMFRRYPAVYTFLRNVGRKPDTIPRLMEHKRNIQRVNTQLWAYATTHNVITLRDMEQLLEAELYEGSQLLGPIVSLPAAHEICQTHCFNERVRNCFLNDHDPPKLCMTHEELLRVLYECVCKNRFRMPGTLSGNDQSRWWESVFSHHVLLHLDCLDVPPTLSRNQVYTYNLSNLAPYGIRINGFPVLIKSVVSMLRPENLTKANQLAESCLNNEVRRLYEQFSEEFFDPSSLSLWKRGPTKVLKNLAKCATELHDALKKWAESRGCVWPEGYLDSYLLFGEFVERVAKTGPFRSLLRLVLALANRDLPQFENLVAEITQLATVRPSAPPVVVDLTDTPTTPVYPEQSDDSEEAYTPFLVNLVKQFNAVLENGVGNEAVWQALSDLEERLIHQDTEPGSSKTPRTLIRWLAEAAEKSVPELNKTLQPRPLKRDEELLSDKPLPSDTPAEPSTFDPNVVCQFVRKLTWLRERVPEDVVHLTSSTLHIPRTEQLDRVVATVLAEIKSRDMNVREPILYHEHVRGLGPVSSGAIETAAAHRPQVDWSMQTSIMLSKRDGVLAFLSTCPPLMDLETWSQWRVNDLLLDRWGSLDQFLSECGTDKACDQYNLFAVRLLGADGNGGLLRLTASTSPAELDRLFSCWSDDRSLDTARALCDRMIGSLLHINELPVYQLINLIGKRLKAQVPGTPNWCALIRDLQFCCPDAFLGPLFAKFLVPCLDEVGLRPTDSWPEDKCDIISIDTGPNTVTYLDQLFHASDMTDFERSFLVSSIGSLGLQLNWPAFVRFFESYRLNTEPQPQIVPVNDRTSSDRSPSLQTSTDEANTSMKIMLRSKDSAPIVDQQVKQLSERDEVETGRKLEAAPSSSADPLSPSTCLERREFIQDLRRREFGFGANLSEDAFDLVRRVEGKLARSLVQLSEDLYGAPGHFLLELIQNADDNRYASIESNNEKNLPTLEFCAVLHKQTQVEPRTALLIMNNEAVGFTENDIASLCDVGVSTKMQDRDSKTGRKGIGFKSVFNVTDAPEVHSNGFHVRFHRQSRESTLDQSTPGSSPVSLLIPEWCGVPEQDTLHPTRWPLPCPIPSWCTTLFVLPLTAKSNAPGLQLSSVIQLTRETLVPSVMLFLRRLRRLNFSCTSETSEPDTKSSHIRLLSLTRYAQPLPGTRAEQTAELITITEQEWDPSKPDDKETKTVHQWFTFREHVRVQDFHGIKSAPKSTDISIAISLTDKEPLPKCPLFAYLPVRQSTFCFYINADFDLTSSREDVDGTSAWNQWLVGQIPNVFAHMIERIIQLFELPQSDLDRITSLIPLTRDQFLGRILSCLPCQLDNTPTQAHSCGGLFYGLSAQLRVRLSRLAWLPVQPTEPDAENRTPEKSESLCVLDMPSRMLLAPDEVEVDESTESSHRPFRVLTRLLIDRLGMHEPHSDLLIPAFNQSESDQETVISDLADETVGVLPVQQTRLKIDLHSNWLIARQRREALLWLGVQTISVDSLLDLAASLSQDEWRRPSLLNVFLTSLEMAITSHVSGLRGSQPSRNTVSVSRRRVLSALHHLAIFPLINGSVIRLNDRHPHPLRAEWSLPVLLPPTQSQLVTIVDMPYDDYVQLLSKLGPVLDPCAVQSSVTKYPVMGSGAPGLLSQPHPEGLEIKVALPDMVLSEWILPALEQLEMAKLDTQDCGDSPVTWLVAVGQLYASLICLSDCPAFSQLPLCLPLITRDRTGLSHIAPPLRSLSEQRRDEPIFLPPTSFTIAADTDHNPNLSDELETRLFQFLLNQLNDSDPVRLISVAYFTKPLSTGRHGCRWLQLFSEAGVCTLLSVHSVRYRVTGQSLLSASTESSSTTVALSHCPLLPVGHRLRSTLLQALEAGGFPLETLEKEKDREWLVEDFVSPGLELLLSLIGRLSDQQIAIETSYQLACLLHDNWNAFERVDQAWYASNLSPDIRTAGLQSSSTDVSTAPLRFSNAGSVCSLGAARWLIHLRAARWLPVLEPAEPDSVRLVSPELDAPIYSPAAFSELRKWHDDEFHGLLQRVCRIWTPGPYITQNPPSTIFTKAMQLADTLERPTFESLMRSLSTLDDSISPRTHSTLTPDFMLKLYRAANRCFSVGSSAGADLSEYNLWLRTVFANPEYPCILVQCLNTTSAGPTAESYASSSKRARSDHPIPSSLHQNLQIPCPVCASKCPPLASGSKRRSLESTSGIVADSSTPLYHLIKPIQVCWIRARLPDPSVDAKPEEGEVDEDEDLVDAQDDQCLLRLDTAPNHSDQISLSVDQSDARLFALADCYGWEYRSFFVDSLGIPFTSSLGEVLSLRPKMNLATGSQRRLTRRHWSNFGRRLGQWYALLDHWLLLEALPRSTPVHTSTDSSVNQSTESRDRIPRTTLQTLLQFPLLLDANGRWYKPADVLTLKCSESDNESAYSSTSPKRTDRKPLKGHCLFAWNKPYYANFILHSQSVSLAGFHTVLAHSLNLFDARHDPYLGPRIEPLDAISLVGSTRPLNLASVEGTAHALLLDVIGLPVVDQVAMITLNPSDPRSTSTATLPSIPLKAVPCAQLVSFFDTFLRLVKLWASSLSSSTISLPSGTPQAYLIDHLTPTLRVRSGLSIPLTRSLTQLHLSRRCLACVVDDNLYMDSTLGADLFARLASLPVDSVAPLTYLAVGLMDDPGLLDSTVVDISTSTDRISAHSLYSPLADHICPLGGSDKLSLTHFLRGFLNVIRSAVPDLHINLGFGVSLSSSIVVQQLQNYLLSHGIRKLPASRLLQSICGARQPSVPSSTPGLSSAQTMATTQSTPQNQLMKHEPPLTSAHVETSPNETGVTEPPVRDETAIDSLSTDTRSGCSPSPLDAISDTVSNQRMPYSVCTSTRNATLFSDLTSQSQFFRLPRLTDEARESIEATSRQLWTPDEPLPADLSSRLTRMMTDRTDPETDYVHGVGRLGELYVYHRLMELVRRHCDRQSNFDQMVGLEFPTGHPILGVGRIVRCHWANADVESGQPFDMDIDVQVECDASQWDSLLDRVSEEISNNVIRIARHPSFRQGEHCLPGLLSVGPIFIEVKSTAGGPNVDSTTDLFEISMSELMCASQHGWRYHLLRVIWQRNASELPQLTVAPKIVHVPDLATELRRHSPGLRLCCAMLRTTSD